MAQRGEAKLLCRVQPGYGLAEENKNVSKTSCATQDNSKA